MELEKYETTSCGEPMDVPNAHHECVYLTILVVLCCAKEKVLEDFT